MNLPGDDRPQDREPRLISVTLVGSDDPEKDSRKLKRIHNSCVSYPGIDRFKIIILREGKPTTLRYPQPTNICDALLHDLIKIVGSDEFIVIEDDET